MILENRGGAASPRALLCEGHSISEGPGQSINTGRVQTEFLWSSWLEELFVPEAGQGVPRKRQSSRQGLWYRPS